MWRSVRDVQVIEQLGRNAVIVECSGEHDLASSGPFEHLLLKLLDQHSLVVVDVSHASFIDSAFMTVLFRAAAAARSLKKVLRVQAGEMTHVRRALELGGVFLAVEHAPTRESALASQLQATSQDSNFSTT